MALSRCFWPAIPVSYTHLDVYKRQRSALREGFGMVLQDTWLFKGTIMENIRYCLLYTS